MSGYKIKCANGSWTTAQRVTSIIRQTMAAPQLTEWMLREAVAYALGLPPELTSPDPERVLSDWRSHQARHSRRGTDVHRWIAGQLQGVMIEPDFDPGYCKAFFAWRGANELVPHAVEQTLLSHDGRVAGTADVIFKSGVLVDWKTSEKHNTEPAWPDQIAQLGAYASMRRTVVAGKEGPRSLGIDEGRVVRLCADGSFHETRLVGPDLDAARRMWRHVYELWKATR